MSLHIGNLSPRVHIGDLEHVFRRFGRCSIRVKDKYGFVVYDYPASAEKALKTLRGTRICGEALTLSWSKHQPHGVQRPGAGGKPYKQPFRKFTAKESDGRRLGSSNRREHEMGFKKLDEGRPIGSSDLADESNIYDVEHFAAAGERDHSYLNNHYGLRDVGKNLLEDDDRWGEQIMDPTNESYLENEIEFERYNPRHEFDENQTASPLDDSSKDRNGNIYRGKSRKNCYLCGEVGHKMRSCPHQVAGSRLRYKEGDGEPSTRQRLQISPSGSKKKELRNKKRDPEGPSSPSIHSAYTWSLSKPSNPLKSLSISPSLSSSVDLNGHLSPGSNKVASESKDGNLPRLNGDEKRITLEEIGVVLKHYGVQMQGVGVGGEGGKELDAGSYFGCGRVWPWEIIYYRRSKKVQISGEDYSRRVAENKKTRHCR